MLGAEVPAVVSWQLARAGTVVDFGYTEKAIDLYTGDAFVLPSGWLNPIGGCLPSISGLLAHLMIHRAWPWQVSLVMVSETDTSRVVAHARLCSCQTSERRGGWCCK